jgi:hypothetical protein
MMEASPFTTDNCLDFGKCVHKKEQSGQIFEEIRPKSSLYFNKVAPAETNKCKFEEKRFLTGVVLDVIQSGGSQKYADVSACLVKSCL